MVGLTALVVQAVLGIAGGWLQGLFFRGAGPANLPQLIAGAIGGVAGGSAFGAVFGAGGPAVSAGSGPDIGLILMQVIGAILGGAILAMMAGVVTRRR